MILNASSTVVFNIKYSSSILPALTNHDPLGCPLQLESTRTPDPSHAHTHPYRDYGDLTPDPSHAHTTPYRDYGDWRGSTGQYTSDNSSRNNLTYTRPGSQGVLETSTGQIEKEREEELHRLQQRALVERPYDASASSNPRHSRSPCALSAHRAQPLRSYGYMTRCNIDPHIPLSADLYSTMELELELELRRELERDLDFDLAPYVSVRWVRQGTPLPPLRSIIL